VKFTTDPSLTALKSGAFAQQTGSSAVDRRVDDLLSKLTLEQKIALIGGVNSQFIRAVPQIGLPALGLSDGPMGVRQWGTSMAYAGGIGLAASWDKDLAHRMGMAIGQDARARGVYFLAAPGVNI
jgi:beta-glucosidase